MRLALGAWTRRTTIAALAVLALLPLGPEWFWSHRRTGGLPGHSAVFCPTDSKRLPRDVTLLKEGTFLAVQVQSSLLRDYFEHSLEHAPPRDPSGVMQRRENEYRAPPDPIDLITSRLTTNPQDFASIHALADWQAAWLQGRTTDAATIDRLERLFERSSLNSMELMEAARAFDWLAGDELAAAFWRAALKKSTREYAATAPGDPASLPLLHTLDQSKALWRLKDYAALEARFRLARRLYPTFSIESRRAGYLCADALFYQRRYDEAADLILDVEAEHERVGDLGALDRSDIDEMNYMQGYLLFSAGRFDQAIPFLRRLRDTGEHDEAATTALFASLLQTGRLEEAGACYGDLVRRFHPSVAAQARMTRKLEDAIQLSQWRRQTASLR